VDSGGAREHLVYFLFVTSRIFVSHVIFFPLLWKRLEIVINLRPFFGFSAGSVVSRAAVAVSPHFLAALRRNLKKKAMNLLFRSRLALQV